MALNSGLAEKSDFEIINGAKGLLNGSNLANHNVSGRYDVCELPLAIRLWPRRWPLCNRPVDAPRPDGRSDLRSLRHGLQIDRRGFYGARFHHGKNVRRQGQRSCSGCRVEATKRRDPVGHARRDLVQPIWNGVSIIVDEVTRSGKGEIEVTAVALLATQIIRAEGFWKQQTQHP